MRWLWGVVFLILVLGLPACGNKRDSEERGEDGRLDEPIEFRTVKWTTQGWCPGRETINCYQSILVRSSGNVQWTIGFQHYADTKSPEDVKEVAALATSAGVIAELRSPGLCGATDSTAFLEIEIAPGLWVRKMILGCQYPAVNELLRALDAVGEKYFPEATPTYRQSSGTFDSKNASQRYRAQELVDAYGQALQQVARVGEPCPTIQTLREHAQLESVTDPWGNAPVVECPEGHCFCQVVTTQPWESSGGGEPFGVVSLGPDGSPGRDDVRSANWRRCKRCERLPPPAQPTQ